MVLICFVTAVNVTAVTKLTSIFHLRKFKPQKTTMMLHFLEGGFSRHLISYFNIFKIYIFTSISTNSTSLGESFHPVKTIITLLLNRYFIFFSLHSYTK